MCAPWTWNVHGQRLACILHAAGMTWGALRSQDHVNLNFPTWVWDLHRLCEFSLFVVEESPGWLFSLFSCLGWPWLLGYQRDNCWVPQAAVGLDRNCQLDCCPQPWSISQNALFFLLLTASLLFLWKYHSPPPQGYGKLPDFGIIDVEAKGSGSAHWNY